MHFLIVYVKPIGMIDTQSCYTSPYKSIQVCTSLYNSLNLQPYTMYINDLAVPRFGDCRVGVYCFGHPNYMALRNVYVRTWPYALCGYVLLYTSKVRLHNRGQL
jgi:hypothetical protein